MIPLSLHSKRISIKVAVLTRLELLIFFGRDYEEEPKEPSFRAKKDVNIAKVRLVLILGRRDGGGQDYGIL